MTTSKIGEPTPTHWAALLIGGVQGLLLAAGVASSYGLLGSFIESHLQGYFAVGYDHTIYLLARSYVLNASRVGLVLGLVTISGWLLASIVAHKLGIGLKIEDLPHRVQQASRKPRFWVLLGLSVFVYLLFAALRRGSVSITMFTWVTLSALFVALLIVMTRRFLPLENDSPPNRKALVLAILGSATFLIVAAYRTNMNSGPGLLSGRNLLLNLSWIACSVLMFGIIRSAVDKDQRFHPFLLVGLLPVVIPTISFFFPAKVLDSTPRNVILIGIDTLRHDRTSLPGGSGSGRELTPAMESLAENGVVFTEAISQAPWTMPAFASILTGRYPKEHIDRLF